MSAHNNAKLLSSIVDEFDVPNVVLSNINNNTNYNGKYKLNTGHQALIDLAAIECDIVITGIIGVTGLHSAFSAISAGNDLAIANKETLVAACIQVNKKTSQAYCIHRHIHIANVLGLSFLYVLSSNDKGFWHKVCTILAPTRIVLAGV